jgi:glyoxylase-like metal-dependent hydrolase (beta-lactamase superfamily II)
MAIPLMLHPFPIRRTSTLAVIAFAGCARAPATAGPATAPANTSAPASADTAAASRARAHAILTRSLRALGVADTAAPSARGFEITLEARAARGTWQQARRWTDTLPLATPTGLRYLVDVTNRRTRFDLDSPALGDIWFRYLTLYDSTSARQVDRMGWRLGTDIGRSNAAAAHAAIATSERLLPHTLLTQALRAGDAVRDFGPRERDGRRLYAITFPDPASGQPLTLELDSASLLPAALVGPGPARTDFADYRTVGDVRVPHRRLLSANGTPTGEQRVTAVSLTPSLDDARFTLPPGYADPPAPGAPRATRVADRVYRLDAMPGGYHAAFVVGDSGVAVLEAPSSIAFSDSALRLIAQVAPGRPVTHVFVTHHHADHVAGLAPYVARGAAIVVGTGLEEAIRRQLPDSLRARARFVPVDGRRSFGAGAARVDALPVPNTHADGNVAYYLPASRVLFQGDLFYIPERGAVPSAFPVTAALARAIADAGWTVDQVIGVHGRTGSWDEVQQSLARATAAPSR